MSYFAVALSSGEILETSDEEQYLGWLDEHGLEVVSNVAEPLEMVLAAVYPDGNDPPMLESEVFDEDMERYLWLFDEF